jgi:hypothetical protein
MDAVNAAAQEAKTNFNPYVGAGAEATSAIMDLLGLGGSAGQAALNPQTENFTQYVQGNPDLLAAYNEGGGAQSMEDWGRQHWATYSGTDAPRQVTPFGTNGERAFAQVDPANAVSAGDAQAGAIGALKNSPLFKMLFDTGEETILQNASATGGLRGGNTQRGLADFGSDTLAKVIQQQLANLGGLSSQGLSAVSNLGGLGAQAAGSIADLFTQQGQAKAGGILGKANASNAQLGNLATGIEGALGSFSQARSGGGGILSSIGKMFF